MESLVHDLLKKVYAAPLAPAPSQDAQRPLNPDEFRMFVYKVVPCSRKGPHSWIECQYAHPQEKAARRCPVQNTYLPIACPDMKTDTQCPRGDSCHFAHSVFEYWLHPARYRTSLCSFGIECKRSICFFAHQPGELRTSDTIAQLQALERDLEATNPAFAAPTSNAKWSGGAGGGGGLSQQFGQAAAASPDGKHQQRHMGLPRTPRQQHQQQQGTGPDSFMRHAMMEPSMQPRSPHPQGGILAPSSSLNLPSPSAYQQQTDHFALTMRLLSDMSSSNPRLQATNSVPGGKNAGLNLQQHMSLPLSGGSSEVQQALSLISQLQELTLRSQNSGDLHTVLSAVLPQLMLQVGAQAEAAACSGGPIPMPAQPMTPDHHFYKGSLEQGYCFSPGSLQGLEAANPFHNSTHRLASCNIPQSSGSPSPADVLSIGSGRKTACGSSYSGSSRSLSPDPSDDGQRNRRSSGDAPTVKGAILGPYDAAIGPFSMIPQGLQGFSEQLDERTFRHDNDLAYGMNNMMGSLSLLVDNAELDAHLSQLASVTAVSAQ